MTIPTLPPDLQRLIKPEMSDADWRRLGAAWESNKRNQRKDSLTPEQLAEITSLLRRGMSVRRTAEQVAVNRGRVWYIYKLMVTGGELPAQTGKKGKRGKSKLKADKFI